MFSNIKTKFAVAAVIAAGAVALPSAASADTFSINGTTVGSATVLPDVSGRLTLIPAGSALRVACDVSLTTELNASAAVRVTGATFTSCATNIPGCTVTAVATTSPAWSGAGVASSQVVNVGGVYFVNSFSAGCPAPIGGGSFSESGTLSPVFDAVNQTLSFNGTGTTGTLTGPLGNATVQGVLDVDAGGTLTLM